MTVWAILPVKPFTRGKSRLHDCIKTDEICLLNRLLFEETFHKLKDSLKFDHILVVSQDETVLEYTRQMGAVALEENQQSSLNAAVSQAINFILEHDPGMVLIIPTDLPMMTIKDLTDLVELQQECRFVVIVPDQKQWGTNAIFLSHADLLTPKFGRRSFQKHLLQALNQSVELIIWLNKNIQRDLDTPQDLLFYNKIKFNPIHILTE